MPLSKPLRITLVLAAPVLFAFLMRFVFGVEAMESLFTVMSLSFLLLLPFSVGLLTIFLSSKENVKSRSYRFFMPWIPVLIFFLLTLLLAIEGWACWIMILPLFLFMASMGGLLAGYYKLKNKKKEKTYISLLVLMPLFIAPVESMIGKIPGRYKAYTYIDIHASKEHIWENVTRVRTISQEQDKGWFTRSLGFPRPLQAELNYEGKGAFRKAIFDKGLVFAETVTEYEHQKRMKFSIKANPYEIPSTTMDQHIVVGGQYFDVLDGTYELEQTGENQYRLHLYSHFKLSTHFNFYASWWAELVMKDIQNNILKVIKARAEQ